MQEPGLSRVIEELLKAKNSAFINKGHLQLVAYKERKLPNEELQLDVPPPPFGVIRPICYHQMDDNHTGLSKVLSEFSTYGLAGDFRPGLASIAPITPEDKFPF